MTAAAERTALDPALFRPEAIDPETAAFVAELERTLAQLPPTHTLPPEVTRQAREEGRGIWGPLQLVEEARTMTIPGPGGDLPLRVFIPPEGARAVYLHIHGGGCVLGRAHHQDPRNWHLARRLRAAVVSVDYRLAPEHPYPVAPDDCEAAALWVLEHGKQEFGADAFLIGGESAGAHLSVVTLLRLRDRHGYRGTAAANLVYGVYDLRLTPSAANWGERPLVLTTQTMRWFVDHFVPPERRTDPDVSPIFADLSGMPPALFTVGTLDPLLDDSLFMYARWIAAGNEAEIAVWPGGVHGFNAFPTPLGRRANERIDAFLAAKLELALASGAS